MYSKEQLYSSTSRVVWIVGVGQGLGEALCRRFCRAGWIVIGSSRSVQIKDFWVEQMQDEPGVFEYLSCDVTRPEEVHQTAQLIEDRWGCVSTLLYNVGHIQIQSFEETTLDDFWKLWKSNCAGAIACTQAVLPAMLERQKGTLLFTGATASLQGGAHFSAFASSKFALRGWVQSLAREYGPQGIHVAHCIVDGLIWGAQARSRISSARARSLQPSAIAGMYWNVVQQDPAAWTHELDLRSFAQSL